MGLGKRVWGVVSALAAVVVVGVGTAQADSCWMHNGSVMRLIADGDSRVFVYERPKAGLRQIGVRRGTELFRGVTYGQSYEGVARIFSTECPGESTEYEVSGPILEGQTKVVLVGRREIYRNCTPTGRFTQDRLVFTYSHQC